MLTLFLCKHCVIYHRYHKDNFYNNLSNKSYTELVWDQIKLREIRSLLELASELHQYFRLSESIEDIAIVLDNL